MYLVALCLRLCGVRACARASARRACTIFEGKTGALLTRIGLIVFRVCVCVRTNAVLSVSSWLNTQAKNMKVW